MSKGLNLIHRSTGPLGEFRMPVCTSIIVSEKILLSDEDTDVILSRYKEHVEFWNISKEIVWKELSNFSNAVGRDTGLILNRYKQLDRGFWRQYLEPVYQMQPSDKTGYFVTITDRLYSLYIETQRTRTVITVAPDPRRPMTEPDLKSIKNLADCLAKHFQVWLDIPGVLEDYVRIFVRSATQLPTGQVAFSPVGIYELKQWVDDCVARVGGAYRPSI